MVTVFSYWKNLLSESASKMWEKLGITGFLFGALFAGVYAVEVGEQTFNFAGIIVFAKILLMLIIIAWIIFVFIVASTKDKNKSDKINNLDDQLNSTTPNIQIAGKLTLYNVNIGHRDSNGMYVLSHITNVASVPFSNNPISHNRNNNAKNIRAEIEYLDENKTAVLASVQGRWEGIEPGEINSADKSILESTNFPNNNARRVLNLIMKYPEDEYCYAYTNESYGHGYFLNPNQIIEAQRFFIQVRLRGEYIPDNLFEFEVTTKGKGDIFQIRQGETWIKIENSRATKTPSRVA